ncbi:MAG: hypothetical protein N3D11_03175, partial [Candidatus Sumerlaeia bacterium]|nr:hypothetical protein [Candidatus Sumerlaeia bacterium]
QMCIRDRSKRDALPVHVRALAMAAAVYLLVAVIEAFAVSNFEDTFCGFMIFTMLGLTQGSHLKQRETAHANGKQLSEQKVRGAG